MRSVPNYSSAPSPSPTFWHWNSPLPYLFGGLGLMLLLITAALILLACSYRKRPVGSEDDVEEKSVRPSHPAPIFDNSPRIVVIMAGDSNPTQLATPMSCSDSVKPVVCVCDKD